MRVVLFNGGSVRLSLCFFFIKQKTAYEMRISDWSSDVCSSDLWDRHIAGYQLVMLSAVADGSQDRVATRDGHGAPAADRTAILRQRFELRRGGQIMLDLEDRWLDPAPDVDPRLPPPGHAVPRPGPPQVGVTGRSGEGAPRF